MTITQLHYALQLGKYQNFKRAAEVLSISQPGLSLQIQKLEDEIGIKLFNRSTTPLKVTKDGELFLIRAQELVSAARQLENFASALQEDFSGTLQIGIIPTLAPFLLPLFSKSIHDKHPDLQLVFKEQITEHVVRNVRNGDLDVGIISTPIDVYGIKHIPLFYERFYVYASQDDLRDIQEVRIEDINYNTLWLLDEGNCFRDQINDFCDLKTVREGKKFIYQSNSIDSLIRIVDNRGGYTILPELTTLSLSDYQEDFLKVFSGKPKAREISLIMTPNYDKARYINLLKDYITSNIPHHMLTKNDYEIVDPNIQMA